MRCNRNFFIACLVEFIFVFDALLFAPRDDSNSCRRCCGSLSFRPKCSCPRRSDVLPYSHFRSRLFPLLGHHRLSLLLFQRRVLTRKFLFLLPLAGIALALIFSPAMLELLGDWLLPAPIQGRLILYLELLTDDRFSQINVLNPVTSSFLFVYWILVVKLPKTTGALDRLLLLSLGLGLASFYAFSVIPVMAFRVMEFLSVGIIILAANATLWWRDRQIWVSFVSCWAVAVFFTQSLVGALGLL